MSGAGPDPATIALPLWNTWFPPQAVRGRASTSCQRSLPSPCRVILLGRLLKQPLGADSPRFPASAQLGLQVFSPRGQAWLLSEECSTLGAEHLSPVCGYQGVPKLISLPATVPVCNFESSSARPGCALQVPIPSSPCPQRSQSHSAMKTDP